MFSKTNREQIKQIFEITEYLYADLETINALLEFLKDKLSGDKNCDVVLGLLSNNAKSGTEKVLKIQDLMLKK